MFLQFNPMQSFVSILINQMIDILTSLFQGQKNGWTKIYSEFVQFHEL